MSSSMGFKRGRRIGAYLCVIILTPRLKQPFSEEDLQLFDKDVLRVIYANERADDICRLRCAESYGDEVSQLQNLLPTMARTSISIRGFWHPAEISIIVGQVLRVLKRLDFSILIIGRELSLRLDQVLDDGSDGIRTIPTDFIISHNAATNEMKSVPEILSDRIRDAEKKRSHGVQDT